jgi:hypothetical protein
MMREIDSNSRLLVSSSIRLMPATERKKFCPGYFAKQRVDEGHISQTDDERRHNSIEIELRDIATSKMM